MRVWKPSVCLLIWLTLTGCEEVRRIESLSWSPDSRSLVFTAVGEAWLVSLSRPEEARPLTRTTLAEHWVSFTPDSRSLLCASTRDGSWDLFRLDLTDFTSWKLDSHPAKDWRPCTTATGDFCLFLSDRDRHVNLWAIDQAAGRPRQLTRDDEHVLSVAAGNDSLLCLVRSDRGKVTLRRLSLPGQPQETTQIATLPDRTTDMTLSPDGRWLVTRADGRLSAWTIERSRQTKLPETITPRGTGTSRTDSVSWLGNEELLVSVAGTVKRVRVRELLKEREFLKAGLPAGPVAVSPDGRRVAVVLRAQSGERGVSDTVMLTDRDGKNNLFVGNDPVMLVTAQRVAQSVGDLRTELEICRRMVKQDLPYPASESVHRRMVEMLIEMDRPREALTVVTESLRDPAAAAHIYLLYLRNEAKARGLLQDQDSPQARSLQELLSIDDRHLRERMLSVEADLGRKRWERAALTLKPVQGEPPLPAKYVYLRGELLDERLGRAEQALEAYAYALATYPDDERSAPAGLRAAELARQSGKTDLARELLNTALAHTPETERRDFLVAEILDLELTADNIESAEQLVNQTLTRPPSVQTAARILQTYDRHGRFDRANQLLERFLETDVLEVRDLHFLLGSMPTPTVVETALAARPWELPPWLKSRLTVCVGRLVQDQAVAREACAVFEPQTALSLRLLRERYRGQKDAAHEAAAQWYEPAMSYLIANRWLDEGEPRRAIDELAGFCALTDGLADYGKMLEGLRDLGPEHDVEFTEFLLLERRAGSGPWQAVIEPLSHLSLEGGVPSPHWTPELRDMLLDFLDRYPDSPVRAVVMMDLGRADEGWERLRWFQRALQADGSLPTFTRWHEEYMLWARHYGHAWLSIQFSDEILDQIAETDVRGWIHVRSGGAYDRDLQDPDRALAEFDWVIAQGPELSPWSAAQWSAAQVSQRLRQHEDAVRRYRDLMAKAPQSTHVTDGDALSNLGWCLEQLSRWTEAEPVYVEVIVRFRDRQEVKDRTLLTRILSKLSEQGLVRLFREHPEDLRELESKMDEWQREAVQRERARTRPQ